MTPKLLLRVTAGLLAFFWFGHTVGGMLLAESRGPDEDAVLRAMSGYTFYVMGFTRSHIDFYNGESWYLSLSIALFAVYAWQCASLSQSHPDVARRLLPVLVAFCAGSTLLCVMYFFTAPLVTSALATTAAMGAWWMLRGR